MLNQVTFENMYLGNFHSNSELYKAGLEYHRKTELYDQSRCRYKNERGVAIPHGDEIGDCSRNARKVKADVQRKYCLTDSDMHQAIKESAAIFDKEFAKILNTTSNSRLAALGPNYEANFCYCVIVVFNSAF